jgi:azobenzene reductase
MQNILIFNFSLRSNEVSNSHKVATFLAKHLTEPNQIINYIDLELPLWDSQVWANTEKWQKILAPLKAKLSDATGYIFVIPEYCGAPSAALANFNLFLGAESNHKPVLLVSVSDGRGGSYPIIGARSMAYKNSKINYIPEHLIISHAGDVLNGEQSTAKDDQYIRDRIDYTLGNFVVYCKAFVEIRNQIQTDPKYTFGM